MIYDTFQLLFPTLFIFSSITVTAAVGVGVLIIIIYFFRRRLWKEKSKAHQDFEAFLKNHGPLSVRRYSYLDIKKMTNFFAEKLGEGGYGGVFRGKTQDGHLVTVKVLNKSKGNGEDFINEVSMLAARGTPGYIAPEVFSRNFGGVSHRSDVYSFGMVVLEMVCGRKIINVEVDCSSEIYFPHWIYKCLQLNEELALRNISTESDRERMRKMVIVSLWCIQTKPSDRPTMSTVVEMLEGRLESLQMPLKPFLSSPSRSSRHSLSN